MFPTKGYLQNAVCPYYQYGLCHRPYCHFKHKKKGKFTIFHGLCSCHAFLWQIWWDFAQDDFRVNTCFESFCLFEYFSLPNLGKTLM